MMVHDDVPAHLRLFHFLDFLVELKSLLSVDKPFLLGSSSGLTGEIAMFIGSVGAAVVVVVVMMVTSTVMVWVVMVMTVRRSI